MASSSGDRVHIVPCEHGTSKLQLSGSPNMLAVTSLQWSVSGKAGYCYVEAKIMWRLKSEWKTQS